MICPFMSSVDKKQECIKTCALFTTLSNGCAIQSILMDCSSMSDDTRYIEKIADALKQESKA